MAFVNSYTRCPPRFHFALFLLFFSPSVFAQNHAPTETRPTITGLPGASLSSSFAANNSDLIVIATFKEPGEKVVQPLEPLAEFSNAKIVILESLKGTTLRGDMQRVHIREMYYPKVIEENMPEPGKTYIFFICLEKVTGLKKKVMHAWKILTANEDTIRRVRMNIEFPDRPNGKVP